MKKQKLYIAGPMTNMKNWNRPAFNAAARFLTKKGFKPLNPAWLDHGKSGGDWANYIKRDIPYLLKCDGVVVLPGWDNSRGAKLEVRIAREVGMPIFFIVDKKRLERVMFEENKIKFGPPIHTTAEGAGMTVPRYIETTVTNPLVPAPKESVPREAGLPILLIVDVRVRSA